MGRWGSQCPPLSISRRSLWRPTHDDHHDWKQEWQHTDYDKQHFLTRTTCMRTTQAGWMTTTAAAAA